MLAAVESIVKLGSCSSRLKARNKPKMAYSCDAITRDWQETRDRDMTRVKIERYKRVRLERFGALEEGLK